MVDVILLSGMVVNSDCFVGAAVGVREGSGVGMVGTAVGLAVGIVGTAVG